MNQSDVSGEAEYFVLATTHTVQLQGDDHRTTFALEALEGAARDIRQHPVPLLDEHLALMPPLGYITDAHIAALPDGEYALCACKKYDLDYVACDDVNAQPPVSSSPACDPEIERLEISYCRRNFEPTVLSSIDNSTGDEVHAVERHSVLPPLEFAVFIPVLWGVKRLAGSFFDKLGVRLADAVGEKFSEWISSTARKSKDPTRPVIVKFAFELGRGGNVCGYVIVPVDEVTASIEAAQRQISDLASVAGVQQEMETLPNLREAAYFYSENEWKLGWWTDGESVHVTPWFAANPPDVDFILGREGASETNGAGIAISQASRQRTNRG